MEEHDPVTALDGPAPVLPEVLAAGESVVVAAGAWGRLGAVVVLRREPDGLLDADTHLVCCGEDGRWVEPSSAAGSGMPERVLTRPEEAFEPWHGEHLWVLTGQLAPVHDHGWAGDVTVMASRAVTTVEYVHGDESLLVPVPASGLVSRARPVHSWRDTVTVRALDASAVVVGEEVYPFLTDADRRWPDPALWAGHWSQP